MSDAEQLKKIYAIFTDIRLDVETRQPAKVYAENAQKLIDLLVPRAPHPVDGELRKQIVAIIKQPMRSPVSTSDIAVGMMSTTCVIEKASDIERLFAAHLQAAEKAYGGCHNCYGKGYATRQAFGNGRTDIPQDPMVYCKCDRGKQLEKQVQAAIREAITLTFTSLKDISYPPSGKEYRFQNNIFTNSLTDATNEILQQLKQTSETKEEKS